jgi:hypothetical protein
MRIVGSRATRLPEIEVSGIAARHSRVMAKAGTRFLEDHAIFNPTIPTTTSVIDTSRRVVSASPKK